MLSGGKRSKRHRAGETEGALTLVAGVALPSRGAAVPTLTLPNTNIDTNSEGRNQPGLFQDDQWQDVFIPVSVEDAPLNSHDGSYAESRKRRKCAWVPVFTHRRGLECRCLSRRQFTDTFQDGRHPLARLATYRNGSESISPSSALRFSNYPHVHGLPTSSILFSSNRPVATHGYGVILCR